MKDKSPKRAFLKEIRRENRTCIRKRGKMELRDVLQKRRSVRKFTEEPVSRADVDLIMHAAMSGPSACNRCPWDFYVVTDPEVLEKLRGATRFSKIQAPMAIVVAGSLMRSLPL